MYIIDCTDRRRMEETGNELLQILEEVLNYPPPHVIISSSSFNFESAVDLTLIRPFIYLFIYLSVHPFIYSFIHLFIHSTIYSFIHSSVHPLTRTEQAVRSAPSDPRQQKWRHCITHPEGSQGRAERTHEGQELDRDSVLGEDRGGVRGEWCLLRV